MRRTFPGDEDGRARPHRSSPSRMVVITVSRHPSPAGTTGPARAFGVDAARTQAAGVSSFPSWCGRETGFSSLRHQAWVRRPTAGPGEIFGSVEERDRQRAALAARQDPRHVVRRALEGTHR